MTITKYVKNIGVGLMLLSLCLFTFAQVNVTMQTKASIEEAQQVYLEDHRLRNMTIGAIAGGIIGIAVFAFTGGIGIAVVGTGIGVSGGGFLAAFAGLGSLLGGSLASPEIHNLPIAYTKYNLSTEFIVSCFALYVIGSFIHMISSKRLSVIQKS